MLKNYNFFDSSWNKSGQGFKHNFEVNTIKGEKVVLDRASSLMWQQGGSPDSMQFEAAQKWITELNKKGYVGYYDWRLPTLEEGMSLMEPKKMNKDRYIDPVFDRNQSWIWTCDPYPGAAGAQWVVYFYGGGCYYYLNDGPSYVRAVRFGQSSP